MLVPQTKEFLDLAATTLNEIFAIGVVVNPHVNNLFGPVAATVPLDTGNDQHAVARHSSAVADALGVA